MSKTFNRFSVPKSLPRQPLALAAKSRKAGAMKHRNAGRGGARNLSAEYLDDLDDDEVVFPFGEDDLLESDFFLDNAGNNWEDVA